MAEVMPDAGPCRWCPHGQWSHKRGRGGCRELDCTCDRYEVDPAAQRAEKQRVLSAVAQVCEDQAAKARTELAELNGHPTLAEVEAEPEPVDEPAPAPPVMVASPAAQTVHAHQVAAIDAQLAVDDDPAPADPDPQVARASDLAARLAECAAERQRLQARIVELTRERDTARGEATRSYNRAGVLRDERDRAVSRADRLDADLRDAVAARDAALMQRDQAYEHVEARDVELGRIRSVLRVDADGDVADAVDRLSADMAEERREHQATSVLLARTREQLREAVRQGTSAASRVLWRYDAWQCLECGFRTTVSDVDHEHLLTPVAVLVARREVAGA